MKAKQIIMPAIHIYMAATILASVLIFMTPLTTYILYAFGAGSGMYAFMLFTVATAPIWLGILLFFWMCAFPIALVISYILSWKRKYGLFYILLFLDTGVVIGTSTYFAYLNDTYGFLTLLPDLIGSIGVLVLFTILLRRVHRNSQGAT